MANVMIDAGKMKNIVSYINGADAILAKQATLDEAISTDGGGVIDALVGAQVISAEAKEACVSKIKEDPTYMLELLNKAAKHLSVDPEGRAVDNVKSASTELSADAVFERALIG